MLDPSEARSAYRSLPWQRRWRLRRATGFARPMTNRKDAAVMLWWARRQLVQFQWSVPLGVYAVALIWGIPGRSGRVLFTLFAGILWGYLFGILSTRRLRESITANAKVAHVPPEVAHAGLPPNARITALTAVAVAAAVGTVVAVT